MKRGKWTLYAWVSLLRWLIPGFYFCAGLGYRLFRGVLSFSTLLLDFLLSSFLFLVLWLTSTLLLRVQRRVREQSLKMIVALLSLVEAKDPYASGHSSDVAKRAVSIGKVMGLSKEEIEDLRVAALLHDIGKIGIPNEVLHKPSRLTMAEFEVMKSHPAASVKIVQAWEPFAAAIPAILHHHERYDGTGYPHGLKGEEIPLLAKVLAVANSIEAMSSERPYRPPLRREEIMATLKEGASSQWDPRAVEAALKVLGKTP
jgi:HD-GYP domain-containing protein (c-di-GMP phosphodiesterase class II)